MDSRRLIDRRSCRVLGSPAARRHRPATKIVLEHVAGNGERDETGIGEDESSPNGKSHKNSTNWLTTLRLSTTMMLTRPLTWEFGMKSATGRWVSGEDLFDRVQELKVLRKHVSDGNHILLTGQRRMGKTSIARELGRRLSNEKWIFLFVDVEAAASIEDVIALLAQEMHPIQSIASRVKASLGKVVGSLEEVSAAEFRVRVRAGLTTGNWRRYGEGLLHECASNEQPVLIVLDELPIFLMRLLRADGNDPKRVDEFLSWLRGAFQTLETGTVVLMVSGSIGLAPLVGRLGMSDRINYLHSFRVGPWDRETSVACFERLAESYGLVVDEGVAAAVYGKLGMGIPHHVQSFFSRLQDDAIIRGVDRLTQESVARVYRTFLLGPSGQRDLLHYETRLRDHLVEDVDYAIAMEVLAEAATQGAFTPQARQALEQSYGVLYDKIQARTRAVLDVLEHDGYLQRHEDAHRFGSRLLREWWRTRFERGYVPLQDRLLGRQGAVG